MLLTIAIPSFNRLKDLRSTLKSCLKIPLSSKEYEILIIDNCSNDGSFEFAQKFVLKNKNFRLVKNKTNVGRIGNWNKCFELAKGKYVLSLFTGDKIDQKAPLKEALTYFEKEKNTGIVWIANNTIIHDIKKPVKSDFLFKANKDHLLTCDSVKKIFNKGVNIFTPPQGFIFRKELIDQNKLSYTDELPYVADLVFVLDYVLTTKTSIRLIPKRVFFFPASAHQFYPPQKQISDEIIGVLLRMKKYSGINPSQYYGSLPLMHFFLKSPINYCKALISSRAIPYPDLLFLKSVFLRFTTPKKFIYTNLLLDRYS